MAIEVVEALSPILIWPILSFILDFHFDTWLLGMTPALHQYIFVLVMIFLLNSPPFCLILYYSIPQDMKNSFYVIQFFGFS